MLKFLILSIATLFCLVYAADRNNPRIVRTAKNKNNAPVPPYKKAPRTINRTKQIASSSSSNNHKSIEEKIDAFYKDLYNKVPVKRELFGGFNYNVGLDDFNNSFNILSGCLTNPSRLLRTPGGQTEYEADNLKKWVHKFSSNIFNPAFRLFEYTDGNVKVIKLKPSSVNNKDYIKKYEVAGLFTGFAIYHQHLLNVEFSIPFLKSLLNRTIELTDLKDAEPGYYKTLMSYAPHKKSNTFFNKYVKPVKDELAEFRKGLESIIPADIFKKLNGDELKLILEGKENYEIEFWKKITIFHQSCNTQLTEWYWQVIAFFDNESKSKMLRFITGSNRFPVYRLNVFTMNIFCFGTPQAFLTANPSIRRMNLPKYGNFNDMIQKIVNTIIREEDK